jgi:DNA-binding IclR family transcriptional regulator
MENGNSQAADRIFSVIEEVAGAERPLTLTEIAKRTNLPKSTAFRVVTALMEKHYLNRDGESERYKLGYRFVAVAGAYMSGLDLRSEASPYLRDLSKRIDMTAHLAVRQGGKAVYIEKILPYSNACAYSEIGRTIDLYCSGLGKSLLLGLPEQELKEYVRRLKIFKFTEGTLGKRALIAELDEARKMGYTKDNAEHEKGVYCIAAPIKDYSGSVVAAISISGSRIEVLDDAKYYCPLIECAEAISKLLGNTK